MWKINLTIVFFSVELVSRFGFAVFWAFSPEFQPPSRSLLMFPPGRWDTTSCNNLLILGFQVERQRRILAGTNLIQQQASMYCIYTKLNTSYMTSKHGNSDPQGHFLTHLIFMIQPPTTPLRERTPLQRNICCWGESCCLLLPCHQRRLWLQEAAAAAITLGFVRLGWY